MSSADILAIITGVGAVVSAVAGIYLAIRAARSKERKANKAELDEVTGMLQEEREDRIKAELAAHKMRVLLAENGITPPKEGDGDDQKDLP